MSNVSALPFDSPYRHGFIRCAVATPRVYLSQPRRNAEEILEIAREADERSAALVVFPELCLTGYSLDDLFQQAALLDSSEEALGSVVEASASIRPVLIVSAPLLVDGRLHICAIAIHSGRILGIVPKTYLPNYREYYEKRQFSPASVGQASEVTLCGQQAPFGALVFRSSQVPSFKIFVEICEDLWTPMPPSGWGALKGATVLCNLSASNATVAKADYREMLCKSQSGRCIAAYLYAGAGAGESTTDLAWDGHGMIWENGACLAQTERYVGKGRLILADVDVERLELDRMRMTSFQDSVVEHGDRLGSLREVDFEFAAPEASLGLERRVGRHPYVPSEASRRDERCEEVYRIQVQGLSQRLQSTGIEKVVIGVSGGLDSTQALLVCARCFDDLGLPRENVLAYSLPGLATSERTQRNSLRLMKDLGVGGGEIDIAAASREMLVRIGHPFADGEEVYDVAFENVQAGERTSLLFRLANLHQGLVVGTGDLSELALGWCTYGVGDQMSHYNVNSSVPKTLVHHLIRWACSHGRLGEDIGATLRSILGTEISPELVPVSGDEDQPGQSTEEIVGPFDLQDFNLYYFSRYGFRPSKVAYLAERAWGDVERGDWPPDSALESRRAYDLETIKKWLEVFLVRFFETSQFKRSAMPNGPKVGSGGSLSPRGDWRAPSDAKAESWLEELRRNVP